MERNLPFPRLWMGDVYKVVYAMSLAHPELDYYTYLDEGRHQTVVWKRREGRTEPRALAAAEAAGDLDFDEGWLQGLPSWFHPATSQEIVSAFERHLEV